MQIRKKGGWNLKSLLIWNCWANFNQTLLKWSLAGPLSKLCPSVRSVSNMAVITENRNFFKGPKLLYFKPESAQIWTVYYGIFHELWTFAYFDRLCKLEKRGDEIKKKIFSSETTELISTKLCWNDSWVVLFQNCVRHFRTPTKMATTTELNLT